MSDAALRWAVHHSVLNGKHHDGVLFGASSFSHVESNLKALGDGELPKNIVEAFENAWVVAAPEAQNYMMSYGPAPGRSDFFLDKYK